MSQRTPIEDFAIHTMQKEKGAWEDATAFVTDRVAFQMRNLIRNLRKNYWGVFNRPTDPITRRKKIWIPLSETLVEQVVKNIDLDTKDINFRAKWKGGIPYTEVARGRTKDVLDKMNFGEKLDITERQLAIDGTVVWKTWEQNGKLETRIVDLLNFYIDPTADSIQETGAVLERAVLNVDEFMSMDGWMNKERVDARFDLNKKDAQLGLTSIEASGETPLVEVWERWGLMSKFLMTGKKEDTEEMVEGHMVASNLTTAPIVHLIELNKSGLKPYEEAWYTRVSGRWYGKGICEKVLMLQLWINTIVNIRINRSYVAQLGLFKIRHGSGITPQLLSRLPANGAITVNDMSDIEQMVIQDASPASYRDEDVIQGWARQLTSAFEVVTGESLPASTPATNAVISDRNAKSEFQLVKEGMGMFLQRWMDRHALPVIMKNLKVGEIIRFSQDDKQFRALVKRVVAFNASTALEKTMKGGNIPSPEEVQRALTAAENKLRTQPDLFLKTTEKIAADQLDTKVFVTNEEIDVAVTIDKLNYIMNVAPEFRADLVAQATDLLGLERPEAQLPPEMQQADNNLGGAGQTASPLQGQTLQSLTTAANTQQQ